MHIKRKSQNKKQVPPVVTFLLSAGMMAAASFGVAWVWQSVQESGGLPEAAPARAELSSQEASGSMVSQISAETPVRPSSSESAASSGVIPASAIPQGGGTPSSIAQTKPSSSAQESQSSSKASQDTELSSSGAEASPSAAAGAVAEVKPRDKYPGALPASGKVVDKNYFDDAIFFGDSISTGIPLYQVMPNAKVVAFTGINTQSVNTKAVIDTPNGRVTMLDAAKQYGDKKKVYIMLGGNSLGLDEASFIEGYRTFLGSVKAQYPKAVIYLQSMTPVTDYAYKTYPTVSNKIIDEYNVSIMKMAAEEGVYYLDVAAALVDESGRLPAEASPYDGMHFEPLYYHKWFDYLKTHTVEEK